MSHMSMYANVNVSTKEIPTKYCKYHLFEKCTAVLCKHTHDLSVCETISCRKMNANSVDMERVIAIVQNNKQIKHLNFGRNRLSKKNCTDIGNLLLSPTHKIESLSVDSTCLGRTGFMCIIEAAAKSSSLHFLDVANTSFIPKTDAIHNSVMANNNGTSLSRRGRRRRNKHKKKKKKKKSPSNSVMEVYHRKAVVECIGHLLKSESSHLQHLILGYNQLNVFECHALMQIALECRKLMTFDLFGNALEISQNELVEFAHLLFKIRQIYEVNIIANQCTDVCSAVAHIIADYSIHQVHCVYQCHQWNPLQKSHEMKREHIF